MKSQRAPFLVALGLFLFALLLRLVGLTWGLPTATQWYSFHPDESVNQVAGAVFRLWDGGEGLNPKFFNYPSLSIYATWLIFEVKRIVAPTLGGPQEVWPILRDIILSGRYFSALCGALTAPVVYFLARQFGLRNGAIFAGLCAALVPVSVQHSHFATVDVPATFFAAFCLLLSARAQNGKAILGAAFVAGLAAGTKYNVGLVLVAPLFALWFLPIEKKNKAAFSLASVAVFFGAYLLSTPYTLLDFPTFWGDANGNGFYFEAFVHPKIGSGDIFQNTGNGWIYHATFNAPFAFGWPLWFIGIAGSALAWKHEKVRPMLVFAGLFFLSLGLSQVRFMRYLLPLAPVMCLGAAFLIARFRKIAPVFGAVILAYGVSVLPPFLGTDARLQALSRIQKPTATIQNPWYYTPPFAPNFLNQNVEGNTVTGFKPNFGDAKSVVISEFEIRETQRLEPEKAERFVREVEAKFPMKREFDSFQPLFPGREFVPHDFLYTHPKVWVYSR